MNNYLNATIVNTFLDIMRNPENYNAPQDLTSPEGLKNCSCLICQDIISNAQECPRIQETLKELGTSFNSDYCYSILQLNRRTTPYSSADIEQADSLNEDILNCACVPDFQGSPVLKSNMDTADMTGLRLKKEALYKAKKGTPEYEKWLADYRAKRGPAKAPVAAENVRSTVANANNEAALKTLKARRAAAGISTATKTEVRSALSQINETGDHTVNIAGVTVNVFADESSVMLQAKPMNGGTRTICTINSPLSDLKQNDYDTVARSLNKLVNGYPDEFLPKPRTEALD